jgi:hypothetical protein
MPIENFGETTEDQADREEDELLRAEELQRLTRAELTDNEMEWLLLQGPTDHDDA